DDFAMLYFSDHGQSVSSDSTPVHHAPGLRSGYDVPLMMMASDITAYSALFDHGLASKSDQRFASIRSTGNLTFSTAF
ncbi:phosphoethanolamine transferase, partial [Escherichia coli]|nr:phosphoethanolamine transferase [Escherichia coli]